MNTDQHGWRQGGDAASFGVWWQSAATTPLSAPPRTLESGVALRFPPRSKMATAFRKLVVWWLLVWSLVLCDVAFAVEPVEVLTTTSGVRFGIWPKRPAKPAPTMFVLSGKLEDTLTSAYFRQAGDFLAKDGWLLVSVDLPSHGQEMRPKGDSGLGGWRARINKGEDPMADVTGRLSKVLDHLLAEKLADPERIGALGTSRGGFVAFHFAAADKRVKCAAGFAPATDLAALSEFRGAEESPLVQRLALEHHADALAGRALWLVIGDRDARVSTDAAIRFARRVTAVSLEKKLPALVDLHVVAEPKGHAVPAGYAEKAAEWFRRQLPTPAR